MRAPLTVFCTPAPEDYIPVPRLSERTIVCGPFVPDDWREGFPRALRTPAGRFDLAEALSKVPNELQPDAVVVWADASRSVEPTNLGAVRGRKVLIIGDTHHLNRPVRSLMSYALTERFDAHVIVATRHHAHFFTEAGLKNVFWIPSLVATPIVRPFIRARRRAITFVGQVGRLHPRRRRFVDVLVDRGYPIEVIRCTREEAALRYSETAIALNISLNSDLNFRPYEVLAAGGFLLTDRLSPQAGLDQIYREREHLVEYDTLDDLCAKLDHYLEHPSEALAIAHAGQAAYLSALGRERIRRTFWSVVIEGCNEESFELTQELRVGARPEAPPAQVAHHAALYEFFQERHLRQETVNVLFLPGASSRLLADIADLPRLRLHVESDEGFDSQLVQELRTVGVERPITFLTVAESTKRHWDVLVTATPTFGARYEFQYVLLTGLTCELERVGWAVPEDLRVLEPGLPIFSRGPLLRDKRDAKSPQRRLHIGGLIPSPGWEVLNAVPGPHVDHVGNAGDLSRFADGTFATLYASHVLEHFDYRVALDGALAEWWRVLEPGGQLFVSVPDLAVLCRLFLTECLALEDRFLIMRMIFGGHVDQHDYHLVGLDEEILSAFLKSAGFEHLERVETFGLFEDTSLLAVDGTPISINVAAVKGDTPFRESKPATGARSAALNTRSGGDPADVPSEMSVSTFLDASESLLRAGKNAEADALYRSVLGQLVPAVHGIGMISLGRGSLDTARALLGAASELAPRWAECWLEYGRTLLLSGRHAEAAVAFERGIESNSTLVGAHALLGVACCSLGRLDDAANSLSRAAIEAPSDAVPWKLLGAVRWQQGRLSQAELALREALSISSAHADAWSNLGAILHDQGRPEEGEGAFRRALQQDPGLEHVEQNRLFYATCSAEKSPDEVALLHRAWGDKVTRRTGPRDTRHGNSAEPDRRLRIGYVSAEFNEHPVAFFLKPVLSSHSRDAFEVVCFANGGARDWMTSALRACADGWHDIEESTDEDLGDLIQRERIDVLVDLAGHASGNRLSVFARCPAPVQVTYLGYPNTTGLASVHYRITDGFADPVGATEHLHVEELIRPFSSFLCYEPPPRCPSVMPPPAAQKGVTTFGCFNHARKLNRRTIALWSRVLHAVPESRLLLKSLPMEDEGCRKRLFGWFAENGINTSRIEIAPFQRTLHEHLACYGDMDIALDTFPYNGTTTTCEALWMGVPVVTRAGGDHRSRVGLSVLNNAGLHQLVAESDEAFICIATDLATDWRALATQRHTMRARLRRAPLMDADRFTHALEQCYRDMWRRWCAGQQREMHE